MNVETKYIVGGAIRDSILANMKNPHYTSAPKDIDYVVTGVDHAFMNAKYGEPIGADFPVWLDEEGNEVALARVERSTGGKTTDFTFTTDGVTLEDDLARRDLTINSMAIAADDNMHVAGMFMFGSTVDVIDPHGGLDDLNNKILRHTTKAFAEDPLRVLRVARFYARYYSLGFTVAPETITLCREMVAAGMLDNLPKERVWLETTKALTEKDSFVYFRFLSDIGFSSWVTNEELMSLRFYNWQGAEFNDDETLSKWAVFDSHCRHADTYGATKKYRKVAETLMLLKSLHVYSQCVVHKLQDLGAFGNSDVFAIALNQMSDRTKRSVIARIVDLTRDVKVDVPEGPEYGLALKMERERIAKEFLDC
ncbi:hypothetical protein NVP1081O_012 [Vibrio phage 1.081.O._10N.286.52.C2]|nr:hypothetical protein NVP1081O_012 [Vibrio phage 1.081.O._10N.286.52.C2]